MRTAERFAVEQRHFKPLKWAYERVRDLMNGMGCTPASRSKIQLDDAQSDMFADAMRMIDVTFHDKDDAPHNFKKVSALHQQVDGSHYRYMEIQPVEYIHTNGLNFCEGNVVKYISRHRRKHGKQDLLKARHFIDLLIELEYPETP